VPVGPENVGTSSLSSLHAERVEIFAQALQGAHLVGRDQPMPIGADIEQLIAAPRPAQQRLSE